MQNKLAFLIFLLEGIWMWNLQKGIPSGN